MSLVLLTTAPSVRAQDLFSTKVRPILAQHCFKCHGPDATARKARLRLDVREEALKPARSGKRPIVPGKPGDSELIARICADDSEIMPPPAAKRPLTAEKIAILKRWIAEGAEYHPHWAFVPPKQSPLPRVMRPEWVQNPIDAFVLARLEKEGLQPSPRADAHTLIRRASLDLIGLPPTPEEIDSFVRESEARPQAAYEKLIDRLLASPHYGERWARRWLDLARYADTNGYEKDRQRSVWPWRDWVINALNADMPFDRFTIEQIAGDLLPNATLSQRIATGFHRNTMLNEEGGIDPLEFRFYAVADRVATTGTVWLGLTLGCAQCHTHKFDPISHKDYYGLFAFLNNADEPELEVVSEDITRRRKEIESQIAARVAELPGKVSLEEKFQNWLQQESARSVRWTVLRPTTASANLPLLTVQDDYSVLASGDQTKSDTYDLEFRSDLKGITAIRIEAMPDDRLPKHGPGRGYYEGPFGDFTLSELTLLADGNPVKLVRASHSFAAKGFPAQSAIDGNPQTGWSVNGGQGRAHWAVFNLAEPLAEAGRLRIRMLFERHFSAGLGRFRIAATTDARPAMARDVPAELEELFLLPPDKLTPEQKRKLMQQFMLTTPELATQRKAIDSLRAQLPAYPTTLVMQERPTNNPRPTFLHHRGEFLQPTERVEPAGLAILHPLPGGVPRDRLTFARWLVSPENPLVGRVTMNQQWAAFFGQGIVRTQQDLGYQGDFPSHPELLDFLAVELVKRGWSLKKMHKLIVMSATYQQSSRVTPELQARDADNRLLARGPRVRLEAEMIRDQALRVSGLLAPKIGGPSVFPPQPPGVTTEGTYGRLDWKVSQGPDRYRRGLYTFSKRTAPYAMFSTFDGPSGEVCVARREVSNTPLQALTLLNDPALVEASRALGTLLASRSGSVEDRIDYLVRRILCRPATAEEKILLAKFLQTQKRRFESKELDAATVGEPGASAPGATNVVERATWTALARVLLNLDETITRG